MVYILLLSLVLNFVRALFGITLRIRNEPAIKNVGSFLAQREGFEPSRDFSQTDFESCAPNGFYKILLELLGF